MTLSQITAKYLKGQKKHTIMSIIAITVSVAFMTVLLCALSVYRATSLNIAHNKNGTYHVVFNSMTKDQLLTASNLSIFDKTEIYGVSRYLSSVNLNMDEMKELNGTQEYLIRDGNLVNDYFLRMDAEKITMLPESMRVCTEGRMPVADGEIVIANNSAYMWGHPQIGDTVTATIATCGYKEGNGIETDLVPQILLDTFDVQEVHDISFTVVGFTNENNVVCYNDTRLRSYSSQYDHMLARFSDNVKDPYWNMFYSFQEAGLWLDEMDYGINQALLNAENRGTNAKFTTALFFSVMYLFLIFIMFCARLVIDDSFEISAKERIKQFGMLKAVGASRRQIFRMLAIEAFYLALPGVLMGLALGLALAYVVFGSVRSLVSGATLDLGYDLGKMFSFEIRPYVYITAVILGFLWVFVSAVATGMRSIRSTPVEALHAARSSESVKIPKRPTKLERGGSFIGAYSSVSIKRNSKRYLITIVSMVLSIVLFTGFSYLTELMREKIDVDYDVENIPYDYAISSVSYYPYESLAKQNDTIDSGLFNDVQCYTYMSVTSDYPEDVGIDPELKPVEYGVINLTPVTKDTFKRFVDAGGMTYEELEASGGVLLAPDAYTDEGKQNGVFFKDLPDEIYGYPIAVNVGAWSDVPVNVKVVGQYTTDNPLLRSSNDRMRGIMSESAYYSVYDSSGQYDFSMKGALQSDNVTVEVYYEHTIYCNSSGNKEAEKLFLDRNFYESYTDYYAERANALSMLNMIKLLGYFVIGIISVIAIINIVNIISANVLNRTSELAMLRACGMSDTQMYSLLLTESLKYAGIAGIVSAILTELMIFVMRLPFVGQFHDLYFDDLGVTFTYLPPIKYLLIAVAFAFATAALASVFPARRTIKAPIVESIRNIES